jgi:O-glycosyl hydrolase
LAAGVSLAVLAACGTNSPGNDSATTGSGGSQNTGSHSGSGSTSVGAQTTTMTGTTVVTGTSTLADGGVITTSSTVTTTSVVTTSTTATGSSTSTASGDGGGGTGGSPAVHLDQTDQTIEGFGINDMYLSSALPSSLFDATNGIGLSILRLGMDTAGAGNLESSSSMQADIATVNAAGGKVIGSVWTPPAACKTNDNANNGGQLCSSNNISLPAEGSNQCSSTSNTNCYTSWATTIANFASTNHLYAVSLANEPEFASCGNNEPCNGAYPTAVYTAKEMVAFIKVAGPLIHAKNVKVIAPESSEWNHLWTNMSACGSVPSGDKSSDPLNCGCFVSNSSNPGSTCSTAAAVTCATACTTGNGYDYGHNLHADSTAWGLLDIVGTHEYDDQTAFPWPTSDFPKDKEVWMTEMAGVKWWPEQGPSSDINDGVVVAGWIHSALVTGEVSAWVWWWYQAQGTNDNEGLLLQDGTDTKRHYVLGNFSKFIRPGYVRVAVSGTAPSNVLLSAYSGSGTVVVVAINSGTSTASVPISIAGGTAPSSCTPWLTSASANLASQTAVSVSGGSFTASLPGPSVTTFVCK